MKQERYVADLDGRPMPTLTFDQLVIHVDGDVAVVSARSSTRPDRHNRYVDTYERPREQLAVRPCLRLAAQGVAGHASSLGAGVAKEQPGSHRRPGRPAQK